MKIGTIVIGTQTFIGLILDCIDWIGLGLIPILADVLDVLAAIYWFSKVGPIGGLALVEVVPLADMLPCNVALGLYADNTKKKRTKE